LSKLDKALRRTKVCSEWDPLLGAGFTISGRRDQFWDDLDVEIQYEIRCRRSQ
jgi:hypothetical protein